MPDDTPSNSFVVFPFLKTSAAITIGQVTFRSTDDRSGLRADQAVHVNDIAEMLFLQDHLRIRSGAYAIVPFIDMNDRSESAEALEDLGHLQALVAYCYASPHPTYGEPFFSCEQASLVILSPAKVSVYLVRPDHHVEWVGPPSPLREDDRHEVDGYQGLYNFKHPFWVTKGSRLYPPVPHIGLNISQDLAADVGQCLLDAAPLGSLATLLGRPSTGPAERILRAIDWFNSANRLTASEEESIISLAVAFEALLGLPENDKKTERLVDSVSLLLGRMPRLDIWVRQFYRARSEIAHEGYAHNLRFVASGSAKETDGPLYHSLLGYGRQVFRLCVRALLFGADLAEKAGLREKLVTNQERFDTMARALSDASAAPAARLQLIASSLRAAERYRFVSESVFDIDKVLNPVRLATDALLACDHDLEGGVKEHLERLASARRSDQLEVLDALRELDGIISQGEQTQIEPEGPRTTTFRLIRLAWGYTYMNYFWLKRRGNEEPN